MNKINFFFGASSNFSAHKLELEPYFKKSNNGCNLLSNSIVNKRLIQKKYIKRLPIINY